MFFHHVQFGWFIPICMYGNICLFLGRVRKIHPFPLRWDNPRFSHRMDLFISRQATANAVALVIPWPTQRQPTKTKHLQKCLDDVLVGWLIFPVLCLVDVFLVGWYLFSSFCWVDFWSIFNAKYTQVKQALVHSCWKLVSWEDHSEFHEG